MMKYNIIILNILNILYIPICNAFCESTMITNMINDKNVSISTTRNNKYKIELGNSISSIVYGLLGINGLFIKNNSVHFYITMNLFILMGISSTLHHYFYTNNSWAYIADINCVEILLVYSSIYILNNNSFKYFKNTEKFLVFVILSNYIAMIVFNTINIHLRTLLVKGNMSFIILNQICDNLYVYKVDKKYFCILFKHNISNGILFALSITFWYVDLICNKNIQQIINSHALWHVFSGFALYNTINTSIIYYAIINNIEYKINTLFNVGFMRYILLNVELSTKKSNIKNCATSINMEDARLIDIDINTYHRRIRSYG
jgi:hypothetical protein